MADEVVRSHNEKLKVMVAIEGQEEHRAEAARAHFDHPLLLGFLVVVLIVLVWRGLQPAVSIEAPPSALEIADVRLVTEGGKYIEGVCRNKTGRGVAKAVFQVFCGTTCDYVAVTNLKPGDNRPFRVQQLVTRGTQGDLKVVPYSIEWQ